MDIVGFANIKKDAKSCSGAKNPEDFIGKIVAVIEFNEFGDVLVMCSGGTALAMFDAVDVQTSFKCSVFNDVITPPGLHLVDQMAYYTKVHMRKGGYSPLLKNMVIAASLHKGEFNDAMLWQKQ